MENRENLPLVEKDLQSIALSENSKLVEIFQLCLQPKTKEDLENILLNFSERIKDIQDNEYFCIFDCICMYVLDYIYKHDTASFCAVSRTLYLYQMLDQLVLGGKDRNLIYNCDKDCLFKKLRQFTDLHAYSKKEEMLVDVGLGSILAGNAGLALYLVKFGLIEFPTKVDDKCKAMFEILVATFNKFSKPVAINVQEDGMEAPIRVDELLNKVTEKKINVRRSVFTFCILTIAAEYKMYEELEANLVYLKFYTKDKKNSCLRKLSCIDLYIQAATEPIITFKDIENFTEVFLNPFITAEVGKPLTETCRKILGEEHNYYNPRSLKDLARLKVRSIFENSISVPEQVNELDIPVALKEFLNFHTKGTWELLVINHLNLSFEHKLNKCTSEIEDEIGRAIGNGNVREVENGNMLDMADENAQVLADGNAQVLADGNAQVLADGNAQVLVDGNVHELANGNVHELEDENVQELADGIVQKLADGIVHE